MKRLLAAFGLAGALTALMPATSSGQDFVPRGPRKTFVEAQSVYSDLKTLAEKSPNATKQILAQVDKLKSAMAKAKLDFDRDVDLIRVGVTPGEVQEFRDALDAVTSRAEIVEIDPAKLETAKTSYAEFRALSQKRDPKPPLSEIGESIAKFKQALVDAGLDFSNDQLLEKVGVLAGDAELIRELIGSYETAYAEIEIPAAPETALDVAKASYAEFRTLSQKKDPKPPLSEVVDSIAKFKQALLNAGLDFNNPKDLEQVGVAVAQNGLIYELIESYEMAAEKPDLPELTAGKKPGGSEHHHEP